MTEESDEFDGFLSEVSDTVEHDVAAAEIQPDFEAMLARAGALTGALTDAQGAAAFAPEDDALSEQDEALAGFASEVATHLQSGDEPVPDFLAVVSRAHSMAPSAIPQSAVEEVGQYAPIIPLHHVGRLKTGQHDSALDAFVGDVRGHVDHELVREDTIGDDTRRRGGDTRRRGGFGIAIAAGLVLALGLGAGLATVFDLGGGLWSLDADTPSEAMLFPRPTAEQESELANDTPNDTPNKAANQATPDAVEPDPLPTPEPDAIVPEPAVELRPAPRTRSKQPTKPPTRRERLATLERDANAAWQAGKLDNAESAFRKIIEIDGRGSWAESAYGELFTLQRQRGRSSVALWKAYLKRFPKGRFADDARAGLCRRAEGDAKLACWNAYLDAMPRGSFRAQAQRELGSAPGKDTP